MQISSGSWGWVAAFFSVGMPHKVDGGCLLDYEGSFK